ncbi:Putative membrane protein [Sphingopyxis fribergensis]|uniref:Putative membrane protein n=1 Tax=Sphingopyxis fribergensis TaxID=1515612 RepID=A0A0A7PL38_9SPHN|nr:hypothetical protein [Sphingopyxis fribergensis]AJA09973.1 Putative membrane protein [Sphingopyxis fribergensis]
MDDELRILNAADIPPALDALDARVLTALAARRREAVAMRRAMLVAALVSLGGGVAAGSAFVPDAVAAGPLTPLVLDSPLAPSTLLNGR